jgi:V8-like Glu-specific endopeptidase
LTGGCVLQTPKNLLKALDLMTFDGAPTVEALGVSGATHYERTRRVFDDRNIIGIGISEKVTEKKETGELGLTFYVEKKLSKRKLGTGKLIPPVMALPDGSAAFTDVKQIGRLVPQVNKRKSPLQSGFSIGHVDITAGTLGAIVVKGGKRFFLSNSHVLANSGLGKKGDKIIFPGDADGGKTPKDVVGKLSEFDKFVVGDKFANRVDAALAEIDPARLADANFEIFGTRKTLDIIDPVRGMRVVKRGRTTGDTESVVQDINFRFILEYEGVGKVGFLDQVLCERYTAGGDSGSIVVDKKSGKIVGLHFAGANGGSVFNPIREVIKALKFKFTKK